MWWGIPRVGRRRRPDSPAAARLRRQKTGLRAHGQHRSALRSCQRAISACASRIMGKTAPPNLASRGRGVFADSALARLAQPHPARADTFGDPSVVAQSGAVTSKEQFIVSIELRRRFRSAFGEHSRSVVLFPVHKHVRPVRMC